MTIREGRREGRFSQWCHLQVDESRDSVYKQRPRPGETCFWITTSLEYATGLYAQNAFEERVGHLAGLTALNKALNSR